LPQEHAEPGVDHDVEALLRHGRHIGRNCERFAPVTARIRMVPAWCIGMLSLVG
jgi:hypothetical protein